ncbi:MAG: polysaccharide deacetylase family protein, partial [Oscillospiraceae bacterium]
SSNKSSINEQVSSTVSELNSNVNSTTESVASSIDIPTAAKPIDINTFSQDGLESFENKSKGWGQGVQLDEKNRPTSADNFQERYGKNGGLFIKPVGEKKVYLTFDQGYENGYTAKILDTLKETDSKVVFFVTMDYVKRNKELVQRMIDEGHTIGNHSVKHKHMPTLSIKEAADEIVILHNYMIENFNYEMKLFRPPYGEWSTRILETAKRLGYQSVFWSYAYLDFDVKNQMGVEKAFPKVTKAVHEGAIYLLHSVSKDNATMLKDVINDFKSKGYELAVI